MKTKAFLIALFILNMLQVSAQSCDEVTLVVSADGATKEEATKVALRSAIEQAYGTFVSSNTAILNDELVKDEIVTLSFGNIKSFKELSSETLPDGKTFSTFQVTVSIPSLVSYAKSKGAEVEFKGATFAMNFKIEEMNKQSEEKIVANMLKAMEKLYMTGFDYKINVSTPKANGEITADIDVVANTNAMKAYELFYNTLENITLNKSKIEEYKELGKDIYGVGICPIVSTRVYGGYRYNNRVFRHNEYMRTEAFCFRSEKTLTLLSEFFNLIYPKAIMNIQIDTDNESSRIQLISSFGDVSTGPKNRSRYGEKIDEKKIFDQDIPNDERFLLDGRRYNDTDYTRYYVAKDHILNYIKSVDDIKNFCYFSYCGDAGYDNIEDKAFIAGYPEHKQDSPIHHIQLTMNIPVDDIMKISKFTISRSHE